MKDIYHIADTPEGSHLHGPLDERVIARAKEIHRIQPDLPSPDAQALALGEVVGEIRASLGFPPEYQGLHLEGFSDRVTFGRPDKLGNSVTVHA